MEIVQPDTFNAAFLILQLLFLAIRVVIGPIPGLEFLVGGLLLGV